MINHLEIAASLDLAIMLDCTGSMAAYLEKAAKHIVSFVGSISKIYPDIPLRLAFIGYRDHCDGEKRLELQNFTSEVSDFRRIVASQCPTGGGDTAEDIFGALKLAENLEWTASTRILYHVGDAPCHGCEFHDNVLDDHPDGDPYGLKAFDLLDGLRRRNVLYFFGEINKSTKKMISRFNELMGSSFVTVTPLNDETMMSTITTTVSSTMSASLSSSSRAEDGTCKEKDFVIDDRVSDWDRLEVEQAMRYHIRFPDSIQALLSEEGNEPLEKFPVPSPVSLKVSKDPFAKGAIRLAYRAVAYLPDGTSKDVVLKSSLARSQSYQTKEKYELFLSAHRAASYLGNRFNDIRPASCESINFVDVALLHFLGRDNQPFFTQEDMIHGRWEKYNSNTGMCAPFPTSMGTHHEAVQAFSHWTFHATDGEMIVIDCQGCYDTVRKEFILTDPAIHCKDLLRYGSTNWGKTGFKRFFKTHVCKEHCRTLGLTMPPKDF
jgi:hypothetical protein